MQRGLGLIASWATALVRPRDFPVHGHIMSEPFQVSSCVRTKKKTSNQFIPAFRTVEAASENKGYRCTRRVFDDHLICYPVHAWHMLTWSGLASFHRISMWKTSDTLSFYRAARFVYTHRIIICGPPTDRASIHDTSVELGLCRLWQS